MRGRPPVRCLDCNLVIGIEKARKGSLLCDGCFEEQFIPLKSRLRDIDKKEDRLTFLYRKCKELDKVVTKGEIKRMISSGYTDELILKTEGVSLWTYGNEPSTTVSRVGTVDGI